MSSFPSVVGKAIAELGMAWRCISMPSWQPLSSSTTFMGVERAEKPLLSAGLLKIILEPAMLESMPSTLLRVCVCLSRRCWRQIPRLSAGTVQVELST